MADGTWRFGVLGPLTVERDGQAVAIPTGHARSMVALLALEGTPVSRDRLIEELWGESPPASAVNALHVNLSKLRRALADLLVTDPAGYVLRTGAYELDAWRFDRLVTQARSDPGMSRSLLAEALDLFRGEPLCDVSSEGKLAQWRRELETNRLEATVLRIDADLLAGAAGELTGELERLIGQHRFEERLWWQLMLALYRSGRQADALDVYQRARRAFVDELGIEPGERMSDLQQRILQHDSTLLGADRHPLATRVRSNVPRPPTRLVGREQELEALGGLMADPEVRILTVTGPGGVGKTRLALELARRVEREHADGSLFVGLDRVTDPALVAAEIAATLARRDDSDRPNADQLPDYLRDRRLLLVLDNFEHLLPCAPLIADLVATAPSLQVLVASRTALRVRAETVFALEPFPVPEGDDPEELSQSPAVQLFTQRALAVNRSLEFDAAAIATVARICRALDGLPLAIELAAGRAGSLTPVQIEQQLAEPLTIGGAATFRDLPDRQRTLDHTIRWSSDLLSPAGQTVLANAAVFLGGFTPDALEAVVGRPVAAELEELVEAYLARRPAGAERFVLPDLVRSFALGELSSRGDAVAVRARHHRHFALIGAAAGQAFTDGGSPTETAMPLLADHANLRAALENAITAEDTDAAVSLALGLRSVWSDGGLRHESRELTGRLLDRLAVPADAEIALLTAVAAIDYGPGAEVLFRRAAERATATGDLEALALITGNLFGRALNAHDHERMRELRPQLLELASADASGRARGWLQYFLALAAYVDGDFASAAEHASLSVEKATEIGHGFMLAGAVAARLLSESARDGVISHESLSSALEVIRRPGGPPLAVVGLWLVARYAAAIAPDVAGQCLAHAERILATLDADLWPERVLREETIAVLRLDDLEPVLDSTPPLDHAAALAMACDWLARRDPAEVAPRELVSDQAEPGRAASVGDAGRRARTAGDAPPPPL